MNTQFEEILMDWILDQREQRHRVSQDAALAEAQKIVDDMDVQNVPKLSRGWLHKVCIQKFSTSFAVSTHCLVVHEAAQPVVSSANRSGTKTARGVWRCTGQAPGSRGRSFTRLPRNRCCSGGRDRRLFRQSGCVLRFRKKLGKRERLRRRLRHWCSRRSRSLRVAQRVHVTVIYRVAQKNQALFVGE